MKNNKVNMWFKQIVILCNIVCALASVGKEQGKERGSGAPQPLPLTGASSMPVFSDYWTSFLNISYVDTQKNVWHTEKTDTARYVKVVNCYI